jgi:drug/metabolite transporter (DMT)-like permease
LVANSRSTSRPVAPGLPDASLAVRFAGAKAAGLALLVAAAALWSLNGPLIKLMDEPAIAGAATGATGDSARKLAVTIACFRSLIGGLVLLPFAWSRRASLRRVGIGWPVASIACFTTLTVCFVTATILTAAANAIILQYTAPIWVCLLSPLLLREWPSRGQVCWMLLALAGVGILFGGNALGERPEWAGLLLALVSASATGL